MAELTINASEIAEALRRNVEDFQPGVEREQVGRIRDVGDGIARVTGLADAAVNELLEFENGTLGLALNLDEDSIGAVVLGDVARIDEGQIVRATGRIPSATPFSGGSSTRWGSRSTARDRSARPPSAGWRSRPQASSPASR
jgi:F-type H+-transporting ATPase subunit alpha